MRPKQKSSGYIYNLKLKDVTVKYTNGKEYVIGNVPNALVEYFGFYYTTKKGDAYVGADPKKLPRVRLRTIPKSAFDPENITYFITTNSQFDRYSYPKYYYPRPTAQDYQVGFIKRRFVKKFNEDIIIEIQPKPKGPKLNNTNSPGINSNQWYETSIDWNISAIIEDSVRANKRILETANRRMPGLKFYLNDLDEFHKTRPILSTQRPLTNVQENLVTNGKEYKLENGLEYIGPYHIHPEKGAMVGSVHTPQAHSLLYPYNEDLSAGDNNTENSGY